MTATFYRRYLERTAGGWGAAAAAVVRGASVVLFAEASRAEEAHWSVESNDPPQDTWRADGRSAGIAAQRLFLEGDLDLSAHARRSSLEGYTRLVDLPDQVAFTADEDALELVADGRLRVRQWQVGAHVTALHESRIRTDSTVGLRSDLRSWTTAASLEVARDLGAGFAAAAAVSLATYKVAGSIPSPADPAVVFLEYVQPDLAFSGTDARTRLGLVTLRWQMRSSDAGMFLQARYAATAADVDFGLPGRPGGERIGWTILLGATLR